jgi:integrase
MADSRPKSTFAPLLQAFFVERLMQQRAVSPQTISSYRDTFRLFLEFVQRHLGKAPTDVALTDMDAPLVLAFLRHLEVDRHNGVRTRNARLVALRSFLKYAAYKDISALAVIQCTLAIPMKRFDKKLVGFLSREEIQSLLDAPDVSTWCGQRPLKRYPNLEPARGDAVPMAVRRASVACGRGCGVLRCGRSQVMKPTFAVEKFRILGNTSTIWVGDRPNQLASVAPY